MNESTVKTSDEELGTPAEEVRFPQGTRAFGLTLPMTMIAEGRVIRAETKKRCPSEDAFAAWWEVYGCKRRNAEVSQEQYDRGSAGKCCLFAGGRVEQGGYVRLRGW